MTPRVGARGWAAWVLLVAALALPTPTTAQSVVSPPATAPAAAPLTPTTALSSASPSVVPSSAPESSPRSWLAQSGALSQQASPPPEPRRLPWRGIGVALALAAIAGLAAYFRRLGRFGAKSSQSARLRVLGSVRVSPKGHVVLVGIGNRAMLIGASDASIRRLAWIDAAQVQSEPEPEPEPVDASSFKKLLRAFSRQKVDASAIADDVVPAAAPSTHTEPRRNDGVAQAEPKKDRDAAAVMLADEQKDAFQWSPDIRRHAATAVAASALARPGGGLTKGLGTGAPSTPGGHLTAGGHLTPGGHLGDSGASRETGRGDAASRPGDSRVTLDANRSTDIEEQASGLARRTGRKRK